MLNIVEDGIEISVTIEVGDVELDVFVKAELDVYVEAELDVSVGAELDVFVGAELDVFVGAELDVELDVFKRELNVTVTVEMQTA